VIGIVLNIFEAVDVITLIKGGVYDDLNLTVGEALLKRSDVRETSAFPSLNSICDSSGSVVDIFPKGFLWDMHMLSMGST
jgi:hypothetical protein